MHPKKHEQFKNVRINSRRGLRVGGVVIPAMPGYWGYGANGHISVSSEAAHEASETPAQEAAEHGSGGAEAASSGGDAGAGGGEKGGKRAHGNVLHVKGSRPRCWPRPAHRRSHRSCGWIAD